MWDYIIIGAGSSGCAAAYQIAQGAPGKSILIVEAGPSDRSLAIKVPAGQLKAIVSSDWGYESEPDPTRFDKTEHWWRGRVLGGSSSINGTMYVRGTPRDYDRWDASLGRPDGAGWSSAEVMPLFEEIENSDQPGELRGHAGPMHVRTVRHPHPLTRAFVEAAAEEHGHNADYNGASQDGAAFAQLSQKGRFRCSAADAFLRPLLTRSNVKLLLDAQVDRIEFDGAVATGIAVTQNGETRIESGKNIIVSAGAINTPKLLMLSGIGDPEELETHGIAPRFILPGVGRNLIEHPLIGFTFRTSVRSFNLTGGLWQKLGFAAQYLTGREGPIANPFEATAFIRSAPDQPHPNLQLHFLPLGYFISDSGDYVLQPYPSATVLLNISYPHSRGRIRLRSADPAAPPRIECRLFDDPRDLQTLLDGIDRVREIMGTAPIDRLIEEEVFPGPAITGREATTDYIRRFAGTAYHPVGTCRMGLDDMAVVAPDLRVRGIENLWIADASVMPDLISGNTNAACLMIGTKLGKQLASAITPNRNPI